MKSIFMAIFGTFLAGTAAPGLADDKCAPYANMFDDPPEEIANSSAYMECMAQWHGEIVGSDEQYLPSDHPPLDESNEGMGHHPSMGPLI